MIHNRHIRNIADRSLVWLQAEGLGYLDPMPIAAHDKREYWDEYAGLAGTEMGKAITEFRVDLVSRWTNPNENVLDFGIGSGAFIRERLKLGFLQTFGYDRDPKALAWLFEKERFVNPLVEQVQHVTFWDALEHLPDPEDVFMRIHGHVFITIPIFEDAAHVLESKHYKPGEHYWYFTMRGLDFFMELYRFNRVSEFLDDEVTLGREDVTTAVYKYEG